MNFDSVPKNEMSLTDVLAFLKHYGYFSDIVSEIDDMTVSDLFKKVKSKKYKSPKLRDAIARFQKFYKITEDGNFGPETMRAMSLPRCGTPDFVPAGSAAAGQCKWPHLDVTYAFDLNLSGVTDEQTTQAFVEACELWNAVCGLEMRHIESLSDANIWAKSRRIDGRGGTLAWSYLPCGASKNTQLEQRYDTGDGWNTSFLREVICHEVGHALGLNHHNGNSIMHPTATGKWPVPQAVDIRQVVSRYGEPKPKPDPEPEPEPPTNPSGDTVTGTILINNSPYRLVPDVNFGGL